MGCAGGPVQREIVLASAPMPDKFAVTPAGFEIAPSLALVAPRVPVMRKLNRRQLVIPAFCRLLTQRARASPARRRCRSTAIRALRRRAIHRAGSSRLSLSRDLARPGARLQALDALAAQRISSAHSEKKTQPREGEEEFLARRR